MEHFSFKNTNIEGLIYISPFFAPDDRGYFSKAFEKAVFGEHGIELEPYEELRSLSKKGVIRGLHFQHNHKQDKLVQVLSGAVYDVAVDLRAGSKTFGKWRGFELTAQNRRMLYIPKGFAHGFLSLEDNTLFTYLCGDKYDKNSEDGILWSDEELNIDWQVYMNKYKISGLIITDKDKANQTLQKFTHNYKGL